MIFRALFFICLSSLSVPAFAIDTSRCPAQFTFRSEVQRVYANSIYSQTPGWLEARNFLAANKDFRTVFTLRSKNASACRYGDNERNLATLSSVAFHDPEDSHSEATDQLSVTLNLDSHSFAAFLPVESYDTQRMSARSANYPVKIKARLFLARLNRTSNFDLGMISVNLD